MGEVGWGAPSFWALAHFIKSIQLNLATQNVPEKMIENQNHPHKTEHNWSTFTPEVLRDLLLLEITLFKK